QDRTQVVERIKEVRIDRQRLAIPADRLIPVTLLKVQIAQVVEIARIVRLKTNGLANVVSSQLELPLHFDEQAQVVPGHSLTTVSQEYLTIDVLGFLKTSVAPKL